MPRFDIGEEIEAEIKSSGWNAYNEYVHQNQFLKENRDKLKLKFIPNETAFYVYKKRSKIIVREVVIDAIEITNIITYVTYGCGLRSDKKCFFNDSDDIFTTKEDAYTYAEHLNKRKNIKYISKCY